MRVTNNRFYYVKNGARAFKSARASSNTCSESQMHGIIRLLHAPVKNVGGGGVYYYFPFEEVTKCSIRDREDGRGKKKNGRPRGSV